MAFHQITEGREMRRYTEPYRWDYDTEEEWLEELEAYNAEMQAREDYLVEQRCEREHAA